MPGGLWRMLAGEEHMDEPLWPLFSTGMQWAQYTQRRETSYEKGLDTIQPVWQAYICSEWEFGCITCSIFESNVCECHIMVECLELLLRGTWLKKRKKL